MPERRAGLSVACLCLIALAATGADANTDTTSPIAGHWEGALAAPASLRLVLHIDQTGDGLKGTVDSPDQGVTGIAIDTLSFKDSQLRFAINAIRATYEARLQNHALVGVWRQGGAQLKLNLRRVAAPSVPARPQTPKPPFGYISTPLRFASTSGQATLAGTLTLPAGDGPFDAVILLNGSGPQDRDATLFEHRPFLVLADHLTRHGFAVLRYDDRGVGESTGRFAGATIDSFAQDALGAVRALMQRDDIQRIGIIGHSEGAMVADLVAADSNDLAFLVRLAGPAVAAQDLLLEQSVAVFRARGGIEADAALLRSLNAQLYALAASKRNDQQLVDAAQRLLEKTASTMDETRRQALGLDANLQAKTRALASPWFRDFVRRNPQAALEQVRVPVFALFGGNDTQVVARQNAAAAGTALTHELSRVKVYDRLNHLFQVSQTGSPDEYSGIEQTLAPEVLDDIVAWLKTALSRR